MTLPTVPMNDSCPCCALTPHLPLEDIERRYIENVLFSVKGNRTRAIAILGISRTTFYRRWNQWQLDDQLAAARKARSA